MLSFGISVVGEGWNVFETLLSFILKRFLKCWEGEALSVFAFPAQEGRLRKMKVCLRVPQLLFALAGEVVTVTALYRAV
jgi:hypothetical protein